MNGYFINIRSSTVRVGLYNGAEAPRFLAEELLPTAVSKSRIIDAQEFAKEFTRMMAVHYGDKLPRLPIFFVLEPELTELFLLTGNKVTNLDEENELMQKQIEERLVDEKPDDLYSTRYKLAPFIYQFVGIKKTLLEPILESATALGLEIGGIFPLGLVLAKTNCDVSSMFVFPDDKENTVVFSELTGVTFAEKFEGKLALEELQELFWKLSVYNVKKSEINLYALSKFDHILGSDKHYALGNGQLENDFEELDITHNLLTSIPNVIDSPANLLNVLPVPEVATISRKPLVVGTSVLAVLLIAGITLQLTVGLDGLFGSKKSGQQQEVLAEHEQIRKDNIQTPQPTPLPQVVQQELKRSGLKIRVENGNGTPGSAAKMKTYLEGFGYVVGEPGNADKASYPKTQVRLPIELLDYKDLLLNDLKTNYSVDILEVGSRPADYDILVIVGQN